LLHHGPLKTTLGAHAGRGLGSLALGQSISLKFSLETGLEYES